MQKAASCIKDTTHLQDKAKNLHVPKDAFSVTADVIDLYPNIQLKTGLKSFEEALDRKRKHIYRGFC